MIDNRIVLPLDITRRAAEHAHAHACRLLPLDQHDADCLLPLLWARDEQLVTQPGLGQVSTDCRDGKHAPMACVGCACACHRHSNRCKLCSRPIDLTVEESSVSGMCLLCLNGPVPA